MTDDLLVEGTESFTVELSDPVGATLDAGASTATGTILDNDKFVMGDHIGQVTEAALDDGPGGDDDGSQADPAQLAGVNTVSSGTLSFSGGDLSDVNFDVPGGAVDNSTDTHFVLDAANGSWNLAVDKANGDYQFTLLDNVEHPSGDNLIFDQGTASLAFTYTVTAPGGSDTGSLIIDVRDDGPTADISVTGVSVTHDETAGQQDNDVATPSILITAAYGATHLGAANSGTSVVTTDDAIFGADGPALVDVKLVTLTNALGEAFSGQDSQLDVTAGNSIYLYTENGFIVGRETTVEGVADPFGEVAFVITLEANGSLSVVQYQAIAHPLAGAGTVDHDDRVSLSNLVFASLVVTDGDGDTSKAMSSTAIIVNFDDDGPDVGVADNGVVRNFSSYTENPVAISITGDLGITAGSDGLASVFVDLAGFTGGCGHMLTSNGHPVIVTEDGNGGLIGFVDGTDIQVFTLAVNTDGTYAFSLKQHLDVFSEQQFALDSGTIGGKAADILYFNTNPVTKMNINSGDYFGTITAVNGELLNPSAAGIGVHNNNFDAGEGIVINLDNEAQGGNRDLFSGITLGFKNFTAADSGGITWDAVWINASGEVIVHEGNESGTFLFADGEAVNGLLEFNIASDCGYFLDQITLTASTDTQVKFSSVALFTATETGTTTLDFAYTATDGDGDFDTGTFSVAVSGGGAENLMGTSGNDVIAGNVVDDILIGLDGDDVLSGDGGGDTFKWLAGESSSDTILGFNASEGDSLDLADLLDGETSDDIGDFLSISYDGTDTTITAYVNGDGSDPVQQIILDGVDLSGPSLQDLLNNGNLVISETP